MNIPAVRLVLLLCLLAPGIAPGENASAIHPLGVPRGEKVADFYARRLGQGYNVQAMIQPAVGKLLDPVSIQATWQGAPLPVMVYYPTPEFALLFVHPGQAMTTQTGTLVFAGETLDGGTFSAGDELLILGSNTVRTWDPMLPRVHLVDALSNGPVSSGRLFGQRIEDLFAVADEEGVVVLDAPNRNTPDPHWAWAQGYVATPFDPRTSSTVALTRVPEGLEAPWLPGDLSRFEMAVSVRAEGAEGPIAGALAWVARTWWARGDEDGVFQIVHAPNQTETEVIVLAPGYAPGVARLSPTRSEAPPVVIRLERR